METATSPQWVLLIAVRMPGNAASRVTIGRRLRRLGSLRVRDGVFALPDSEANRLALDALGAELARMKGSAVHVIGSWTDAGVEARMLALRAREQERERRRLNAQIERLERMVADERPRRSDTRRTAPARLARLRRVLASVEAREAPAPLTPPKPSLPSISTLQRPAYPRRTEGAEFRNRVWTTRAGVLVDRIGSAWLIRRFVDRDARFRFVRPGEAPHAADITFDMADGRFTHEGNHCTFETLAERFGAGDEALRALGEIVHDLDFKDGAFGRPEAAGLARLIAGLALIDPNDEARIAHGLLLFDSLYAALRSQGGSLPNPPKGASR